MKKLISPGIQFETIDLTAQAAEVKPTRVRHAVAAALNVDPEPPVPDSALRDPYVLQFESLASDPTPVYVTISEPVVPDPYNTDFTVEFKTGKDQIVNISDPDYTHYSIYAQGIASGGPHNRELYVGFYRSTTYYSLYAGIGGRGKVLTKFPDDLPLSDIMFAHWKLVKIGTNIEVYRNGNLVTSTTINTGTILTPDNPASTVQVGAYTGLSDEINGHFDGVVYDVKVEPVNAGDFLPLHLKLDDNLNTVADGFGNYSPALVNADDHLWRKLTDYGQYNGTPNGSYYTTDTISVTSRAGSFITGPTDSLRSMAGVRFADGDYLMSTSIFGNDNGYIEGALLPYGSEGFPGIVMPFFNEGVYIRATQQDGDGFQVLHRYDSTGALVNTISGFQSNDIIHYDPVNLIAYAKPISSSFDYIDDSGTFNYVSYNTAGHPYTKISGHGALGSLPVIITGADSSNPGMYAFDPVAKTATLMTCTNGTFMDGETVVSIYGVKNSQGKIYIITTTMLIVAEYVSDTEYSQTVYPYNLPELSDAVSIYVYNDFVICVFNDGSIRVLDPIAGAIIALVYPGVVHVTPEQASLLDPNTATMYIAKDHQQGAGTTEMYSIPLPFLNNRTLLADLPYVEVYDWKTTWPDDPRYVADYI